LWVKDFLHWLQKIKEILNYKVRVDTDICKIKIKITRWLKMGRVY
jgi:hypothetical protein